MKSLCILPAAGNATRMNGLPKFALPINENNQTLIGTHVLKIEPHVDQIIVATKKENLTLINNLNLGNKSTVISMDSMSMSDTVLQVLENFYADRYVLFMPDTYFHGENPHEYLAKTDNFVDLAIFKIRKEQKGKLGQVQINRDMQVDNLVDKSLSCDFPYAWGALGFGNDLIKYINKEDPHIGYAVNKSLNERIVKAKIMHCEYFDCGTPQEYFDLIKKL